MLFFFFLLWANSFQTYAQEDKLFRLIVFFQAEQKEKNDRAIDKYEKYIKSFQKKTGISIFAEKIFLGKEGEAKFCMELKELGTKNMNQFIKDTKEFAKRAKNNEIEIRENIPCLW